MVENRSARWPRLAAEFTVIVVGVLTALAVDAWWAHAADRSAEAVYLEQIERDLGRNRALLGEAISLESTNADLVRKVESAMYAADPPDPDSIRSWMGGRFRGDWWYSDPRLVDGTLAALVETGDLALLRDAVLRSQILDYLGQVDADAVEFRRFVQLGLDAESTIARRGEAGMPDGVTDRPEREVRHLLRVYGDPEGRAAVRDLRVAYTNRIWYLEQMLLATDSLLASVTSRSR